MNLYLLFRQKISFACYFLLSILFLSYQAYAQKEAEKIKSYLQGNAGTYHLSANDLREMSVSSAYQSPTTGWYHVYYTQVYQSIEVFNGMLNVTYVNNHVAHVGNTFVEDLPSKIVGNGTFAQLSPANAIDKLAGHLSLPYIPDDSKEQSAVKLASGQISRAVLSNSRLSNKNIPVKLYWFPYQQNGSNLKVALVWNVQLHTKDNKHHWSAQIDAQSGEVIEIKDQVIHCEFGHPNHPNASYGPKHSTLYEEMKYFKSLAPNSYNVFDLPIESPSHGNRTVVSNPYTRFAPTGTGPGATNGWHDDGTTSYTTTRGNNVLAKEDNDANNETVVGTSPGSANLNFDYSYTKGLNTAAANRDAAITNLFYWNNLVHDVLWKYGFDEPSGNFQQNNMGRGGLGNDYILADAQDGSDNNNARFYSAKDGEICRIEMYFWNDTGSPAYQPDGDFDNGIISHEYGHGWSIRLTGGPATSTCLYNAEQPGEGWSDYLSLMLTTNWSDLTPTLASANLSRGIGTYAIGQTTEGGGIRPYPYSYDMVNVNGPVTYSRVSTYPYTHGIGSVWATALWDMTWEIIMQDNQIVSNIYNTSTMVGNVAALKLVNEGLRLQPCSPSFIDARDAILKADMLLFNGRYSCSIWKAFARRGVGLNASTNGSSNDINVTQDFTPVTDQNWTLSSPTIASVCSNNLFNYTAIASGPTTFKWTRAAVEGISNAAASGNTNTISETLINTTNDPIDVIYQFSFAPGSCQVPISVRVTVRPSPKLSVPEYAICQNSTVPLGEGLIANFDFNNSVSGTFTTGMAPYRRSTGNNSTVYSPAPVNAGNSVYYRTHIFTPLNNVTATIETINGNLSGTYPFNTFLALYQGSFNPGSPAANFLIGDDDSGALPKASRITYNFTAGTTYILVVSPADNNATGDYQLMSTGNIFGNNPNWYSFPSGAGAALASGPVFNPVGVPLSGIANTATPIVKTFYLGTPEFTCRTPATFTITPSTQGGSIAGNAIVCTNINTGELTLSGYTGTILRWESSTNNFTDITEINNTTSSFVYNNLTQSTQFRAVIKNGICNALNSTSATISKLNVVLPNVSDYNTCRGNTIPVGEGMVATSSARLNTMSGALVAGSATYWRGAGNNANTYSAAPVGQGNIVYYKTHIISPAANGIVNIEVMAAALSSVNPNDTHLALYISSFNPGSPATNFLNGDDDSGTLSGASKLVNYLFAGNTYILVVSSHANNVTGTYQLQANTNVFKNESDWYLASAGGTSLSKGDVFNPVGVAGTNIVNTANVVKKTFYAAPPDFPTCRIPVQFAINAQPVTGTIRGDARICTDALSGALTLTGHNCPILRWESSTDNFVNFTTIADTSATLSYTNLTESTQYRVWVNNPGCVARKSYSAFVVKQTKVPTATSYEICQGGIVPAGQGLSLNNVNSAYTNKADGFFAPYSILYHRGDGDNPTTYTPAIGEGVYVYCQPHSIKASVGGVVSFEVIMADLTGNTSDTFITLYENSFDPPDPATNFLIANNNGPNPPLSKLSYNLAAGKTYILVVAAFNNAYRGFYRVQASANVFDTSNNAWFENTSTLNPLTTGNVFNPIGFAGSEILNTSIPLAKTCYVGSPDYKDCRTPVTFGINPPSVGGTIAGSALVCTNTNSGTLTLSGHTGVVEMWESSSDNFVNVTPIANTTPTLTYNNLTQATQYRAVVKSGACNTIRSAEASISRTLTTAPLAQSISRCGPGVVTLTAKGCKTGTPAWYNDYMGETALATGGSFNIPNLTETASYYVGCVLNLCSSERQMVLATPNINAIYNSPQMSQQAGNYRASQTITSSNNVNSGVNYFAGKSILLSPGFQAGGNEVFMAKIEGCP